MPWFKVDDNLPFHAKTVAAGNPAMGLWVRSGAWSAQQLTDGLVPKHMISSLGTAAQAKALVSAGLWVPDEDGFRFWQWAERQPTRESVLAEREEARERMARVRSARRSGSVRANTDRTSAEVRLTPTRPDPTRPVLVAERDEEVQEVEVDDDWLSEHGVMSTSELPETSHTTTAFDDVPVVDGLDPDVVVSIFRRLGAA